MTHVRTLLTSSAFSMLLALGAAPALAQLGSGAGGSGAALNMSWWYNIKHVRDGQDVHLLDLLHSFDRVKKCLIR